MSRSRVGLGDQISIIMKPVKEEEEEEHATLPAPGLCADVLKHLFTFSDRPRIVQYVLWRSECSFFFDGKFARPIEA